MNARVFVRHGELVADVVALHDGGRYYAGTLLPETRKVLPQSCGTMRKSEPDTVAALLAMGYEHAPAAFDPSLWLDNAGGAK